MSPVATLGAAAHPIWLWTRPEEVESAALDQLRNVASLPYVHHHVAVMPDVHLGYGATVGSVIALRDAVSPAAVGVDIGCGMAAARTNLTAEDLPDDLGGLRAALEAAVPVGMARHPQPTTRARRQADLWNAFDQLHPRVAGRLERAMAQLGTLGSGNHFLEVCLDTDDAVWIMLHSGSRNIGKELAEAHIAVARTLEHNAGLPDRDLAVFLAGTPQMRAYRHDLDWAQSYAQRNRDAMLAAAVEALRTLLPDLRVPTPPRHGPYAGDRGFALVNCHHNYVAEEHHFGADVLVTRKGAISARDGEFGIIPGSMGTRSYLVRGRGNPDSFHSASHGAGRTMSRNRARRTFTVADLADQTRGVECRKDRGVLDEIPAAYKDIDAVLAAQEDLVEIVAELRAVLCVKG
ncbi:RNA-splicing ligase RtcB [Frankia canadensis]|uniref:3'-phosphate/5'-hydroxy nucleic acid ligase n=1 Tax=Frankia canadensis TaxID=1836972 RepID=A0A2I2L0X6_9ACTN|nr:RtcB family protein [Frankia canadensis]SNQ51576.1 RNA-splicing ligase RtcB [Frankia canadensis]SOU58866.1 RNA-splicing ligase RtcB [Frankia canadensis]